MERRARAAAAPGSDSSRPFCSGPISAALVPRVLAGLGLCEDDGLLCERGSIAPDREPRRQRTMVAQQPQTSRVQGDIAGRLDFA
jgi:hypothetical protein